MTSKIARRVLLLVLAIGAALGAVAASAAAPEKAVAPGFALSIDSSVSSISAGESATYRVTIARDAGFTGGVTPSVSGAPSGAQVGVSPGAASPSATEIFVTVQTYSTTAARSYALTIAGTSGRITQSVGATLTVTAAVASTFSLGVADDNWNVAQGGAATFVLAISRKSFPAPISFTVTGGPAQSQAAFFPPSTAGSTTSLVVATGANTPQGSYTLTIKGASGAVTSTVLAHLTVSSAKGSKNFSISGDVATPLGPGNTAPIDLALTNPNNQTLYVTSLAVSVRGTSRSACAATNFAVQQYSGSYALAVPANSTRRLSQLGVATAKMPALTFLDRPAGQDACKRVSINLDYTGVGQGNP